MTANHKAMSNMEEVSSALESLPIETIGILR